MLQNSWEWVQEPYAKECQCGKQEGGVINNEHHLSATSVLSWRSFRSIKGEAMTLKGERGPFTSSSAQLRDLVFHSGEYWLWFSLLLLKRSKGIKGCSSSVSCMSWIKCVWLKLEVKLFCRTVVVQEQALTSHVFQSDNMGFKGCNTNSTWHLI